MGLLVLVEQEGVGRGLMQKNWIEGWMIRCQVPGTSTSLLKDEFALVVID
jgi:hypothetical protein